MIISEYICSQINIPICRYISDKGCVDRCRAYYLGDIRISSAVTVFMIISTIFLTIKIIHHVHNLISSIGRQEMVTLFCLYVCSLIAETLILILQDTSGIPVFVLTLFYIASMNTTYFSLMVGSITTDMFIGKWGMKSETLLYVSNLIYFIFNVFVVFSSMMLRETLSMLILSFGCNATFVFIYFIIQMRKLNRNKGEVWAYGTLGISITFFILGIIPIFVGGGLIAILSDKYVDNLFFHNLFVFCALIMIHKYWFSTCDYEVECLVLDL